MPIPRFYQIHTLKRFPNTELNSKESLSFNIHMHFFSGKTGALFSFLRTSDLTLDRSVSARSQHLSPWGNSDSKAASAEWTGATLLLVWESLCKAVNTNSFLPIDSRVEPVLICITKALNGSLNAQTSALDHRQAFLSAGSQSADSSAVWRVRNARCRVLWSGPLTAGPERLLLHDGEGNRARTGLTATEALLRLRRGRGGRQRPGLTATTGHFLPGFANPALHVSREQCPPGTEDTGDRVCHTAAARAVRETPGSWCEILLNENIWPDKARALSW